VSIRPLQIGQWPFTATSVSTHCLQNVACPHGTKAMFSRAGCIAAADATAAYSFHLILTPALQVQTADISNAVFEISAGGKSGKQVKHLIRCSILVSVFVISKSTGQSDFLRFSYNCLRKMKPATFDVEILTVHFFQCNCKSILVVCHNSRWLKIRCQCLHSP